MNLASHSPSPTTQGCGDQWVSSAFITKHGSILRGYFSYRLSNSSIDIKMYTQTFVTELFAVLEDLNVPQQGQAVWTRVR